MLLSLQVDEVIKPVSPVKLVEPKVTGGRWDYVIGLVVNWFQYSLVGVLS